MTINSYKQNVLHTFPKGWEFLNWRDYAGCFTYPSTQPNEIPCPNLQVMILSQPSLSSPPPDVWDSTAHSLSITAGKQDAQRKATRGKHDSRKGKSKHSDQPPPSLMTHLCNQPNSAKPSHIHNGRVTPSATGPIPEMEPVPWSTLSTSQFVWVVPCFLLVSPATLC